jgi:hypothetical protein
MPQEMHSTGNAFYRKGRVAPARQSLKVSTSCTDPLAVFLAFGVHPSSGKFLRMGISFNKTKQTQKVLCCYISRMCFQESGGMASLCSQAIKQQRL